jgi:hypothetical protein
MPLAALVMPAPGRDGAADRAENPPHRGMGLFTTSVGAQQPGVPVHFFTREIRRGGSKGPDLREFGAISDA